MRQLLLKSVRKLIKYIQRYCPNANKIIRHFDVNGKHCPAPIMDDKIWKKFRKEILKNKNTKTVFSINLILWNRYDNIIDIFIYGIVTILSDSKNAVF